MHAPVFFFCAVVGGVFVDVQYAEFFSISPVSSLPCVASGTYLIRWMDGWMDERKDGQEDGRMDDRKQNNGTLQCAVSFSLWSLNERGMREETVMIT